MTQSQFDGTGRNCLAISIGNQETPKIESQSGQENVIIAKGAVCGEAATVNAAPTKLCLQWGQSGFVSFIDNPESFSGFIEFQTLRVDLVHE